jgi:hypothetical protein
VSQLSPSLLIPSPALVSVNGTENVEKICVECCRSVSRACCMLFLIYSDKQLVQSGKKFKIEKSKIFAADTKMELTSQNLKDSIVSARLCENNYGCICSDGNTFWCIPNISKTPTSFSIISGRKPCQNRLNECNNEQKTVTPAQ